MRFGSIAVLEKEGGRKECKWGFLLRAECRSNRSGTVSPGGDGLRIIQLAGGRGGGGGGGAGCHLHVRGRRGVGSKCSVVKEGKKRWKRLLGGGATRAQKKEKTRVGTVRPTFPYLKRRGQKGGKKGEPWAVLQQREKKKRRQTRSPSTTVPLRGGKKKRRRPFCRAPKRKEKREKNKDRG